MTREIHDDILPQHDLDEQRALGRRVPTVIAPSDAGADTDRTLRQILAAFPADSTEYADAKRELTRLIGKRILRDNRAALDWLARH